MPVTLAATHRPAGVSGRRASSAGRARLLAVVTALSLVASACATPPDRYPILPSNASVSRGGELYAQNCATCHGTEADPRDMRAVPPPHNGNGHTWHHPDQLLVEIILDGFDSSRPDGQKMPAFKETLSEEDVRAVIAFLRTWWSPEQRGWQATVTAQTLELDREQAGK